MNTAMNSTLRVAQLLRVLHQVEGRKKLHKEVHILQELGCPFPERFDYSYYGMYSRELRSEVGTLVKEKLIHETANPNPAGESTYTFESTPELEQFLDRLKVEKAPFWAPLAERLNALPTQWLEGISTILFLRRAVDEPELSARFHALKPHLAKIYTHCEKELKTLKMPKAGMVPP
jgi:uncharacterized protein